MVRRYVKSDWFVVTCLWVCLTNWGCQDNPGRLGRLGLFGNSDQIGSSAGGGGGGDVAGTLAAPTFTPNGGDFTSSTNVTIRSDGFQAETGCAEPCLSTNGRYVAFGSGATNLVPGDNNALWDVFVYDRGP